METLFLILSETIFIFSEEVWLQGALSFAGFWSDKACQTVNGIKRPCPLVPIAEHAVVLIEVIVGKQAVPDIFQLAGMCVVLLNLLHGFLKFVLGVGSQCAIGAGTCEKSSILDSGSVSVTG